jgi:hypothetical protein
VFPVSQSRAIAVLCALLAAFACSGPVAPSPPVPPPGPGPTPTPNNPPRIVSLAVSSDRIEVGEEITVTAAVLDDETAADDLHYEWRAASGAIVGTGRIVKWKAPTAEATPATYKLSVTVIDRYASGGQTLEHRATAETSEIHVDNSERSLRTLAVGFFRDFANSNISPQECVRNFSDSCPGKRRELQDITENRQLYWILSSDVDISSVRINSARTRATVNTSCEFRSRVIATGATVVARGFCILTAVNESYRWWLCDSSATGNDPDSLAFFSSAFGSED